MNTELNTMDRLMIISAVVGLFLAALAFLMPVAAEAGVTVTARSAVAVAPDSPRGVIVQTGPRIFRYEARTRPVRPISGRFFWVAGHYEKVLEVRNCRQNHHLGQGKFKRTKTDLLKKGRRRPKGMRHNHYREIWVPGHWERA